MIRVSKHLPQTAYQSVCECVCDVRADGWLRLILTVLRGYEVQYICTFTKGLISALLSMRCFGKTAKLPKPLQPCGWHHRGSLRGQQVHLWRPTTFPEGTIDHVAVPDYCRPNRKVFKKLQKVSISAQGQQLYKTSDEQTLILNVSRPFKVKYVASLPLGFAWHVLSIY